jgi:hypothetical protein
MLSYGKWDEVIDCNGMFAAPGEASKPSSFRITSAMYLVAANCEIFSGSAMKYKLASAPDHEIVELMLASYTNYQLVCENALMEELTFPDRTMADWSRSRISLKWRLATLTPGRFYRFDKFEDWIRLTCYNFLTFGAGKAKVKAGYDHVEATWEKGEHRALQAFLCCFCAMGIIDLSFRERPEEQYKLNNPTYDEPQISTEITGLRLTQLGAYVLGVENSYQPKEPKQVEEGGLVVTPDFCAIVTGPKSQLEHAPYLSKFMANPKTSGNAASYQLDFFAFTKALDAGLSGQDLRDYLTSKSSKPVPENVLRTLDDWIERSKKIRIRTVTLVEADDEFLIAEMASFTGADSCDYKPLKHVAEINGNEVKKFKKILEKNGKYAKLDE